MTTIDEHPAVAGESTQEFAERIVGAVDSASLAILLSIGHQTRLFDTMADLPPATSAQIADAAGLERTLRARVAGRRGGRRGSSTTTRPRRRTSCRAHRAAVLTRAAGPDNLARVAQFIPLLAEVEQKVIGCFRTGGGLSYSEYPRFHTLMAEQSGEVFDAALIDVILPMADGLPERLSAGAEVADFGCGSGHAINVMAQALSGQPIHRHRLLRRGPGRRCRRRPRDSGLTNASFIARDVARFDVIDAYDVITAFDAIHDQAQPARVLENIYRALRPGGVFLMVDIKASSKLEDNVGVPFAPYLYTVSTMHCMSVSLGLDGDGLGTVWGRQLATSMLADAGFGDVQVREIESDPINYYYVARK